MGTRGLLGLRELDMCKPPTLPHLTSLVLGFKQRWEPTEGMNVTCGSGAASHFCIPADCCQMRCTCPGAIRADDESGSEGGFEDDVLDPDSIDFDFEPV